MNLRKVVFRDPVAILSNARVSYWEGRYMAGTTAELRDNFVLIFRPGKVPVAVPFSNILYLEESEVEAAEE